MKLFEHLSLLLDHLLEALVADDAMKAVKRDDLSGIQALRFVIEDILASVVRDPYLNALVFEFYRQLVAPLDPLGFEKALL